MEAGGIACNSATEAVQSADLVVTMVTDGSDVEQAPFDPKGAQEILHADALIINMSTISPFLTREMASRGGESNFRYLDAPVTDGQSVKLCNQVSGEVNLLGECITLTLGHKPGIDPNAMMHSYQRGGRFELGDAKSCREGFHAAVKVLEQIPNLEVV